MNPFEELYELKMRLTLTPEEKYILMNIQKGETAEEELTRALRQLADNKSVSELADLIGTSRQTIYRALNNHKIVKADIRLKFIEYLDKIGYRFR